jgi:hypothetical protein
VVDLPAAVAEGDEVARLGVALRDGDRGGRLLAEVRGRRTPSCA